MRYPGLWTRDFVVLKHIFLAIDSKNVIFDILTK